MSNVNDLDDDDDDDDDDDNYDYDDDDEMFSFFGQDTGGTKEKIRVLLIGVETMTFRFLFQMMII